MEISATEERKLNQWLEKMKANNIVVAYDDEFESGFFYVPARGEDGADGIPIRHGITRMPADAKPITSL